MANAMIDALLSANEAIAVGEKAVTALIKQIAERDKTIERLQDENDRFTFLLGDALKHTPETYQQPILAKLKRKVAEEQARNNGST